MPLQAKLAPCGLLCSVWKLGTYLYYDDIVAGHVGSNGMWCVMLSYGVYPDVSRLLGLSGSVHSKSEWAGLTYSGQQGIKGGGGWWQPV